MTHYARYGLLLVAAPQTLASPVATASARPLTVSGSAMHACWPGCVSTQSPNAEPSRADTRPPQASFSYKLDRSPACRPACIVSSLCFCLEFAQVLLYLPYIRYYTAAVLRLPSRYATRPSLALRIYTLPTRPSLPWSTYPASSTPAHTSRKDASAFHNTGPRRPRHSEQRGPGTATRVSRRELAAMFPPPADGRTGLTRRRRRQSKRDLILNGKLSPEECCSYGKCKGDVVVAMA